MASPKPRTYTVRPSSIRLGQGCISLMPCIWSDHFVQRRTPPQVQGNQSAGQFGHPVLEAAGLAQAAEDLEGLAVFVQADR